MLIDIGFDVKVCQDADETLAALAVTPFDLAVVDFHLSRGTSESIIDELRRRAIPYALCSGSMEDELRESFGDAVTVTKPFTDETIRAAVDQLIGARSFA
jgi:CheY-like chemotaxis protein